MNQTASSGIWVYAEQTDGVLSSTTLELLAKATELKAQLGGADAVTAVLPGSGVSSLTETLFAYGADRVLLAEHEHLAQYKARPYKKVLVELARKYHPSIFLFPASVLGRDLAPRVMCALNTGLTADAIDLGIDENGVFYHTTPAYGGKILVNIAIPEARPQMVTVRAQVFTPLEPRSGRTGEVVREFVEVEDDDAYIIRETTAKNTDGTSLSESNVIVAGGRGIRSEQDLALLKELAELLGGQTGCSRPLCENGWMHHDTQIGQSGVTVKPQVILNIGISGAGQYTAGMEKSGCIISINHTAAAPIFEVSHYGTVTDYRPLLPVLVSEIKRRKRAQSN